MTNLELEEMRQWYITDKYISLPKQKIMIKPNELRIGNWVNVTHLPNRSAERVNRIDYDSLLPNVYYVNGRDLLDINPIPLAPEILEKARFETTKHLVYPISYKHTDNYSIKYSYDNNFLEFNESDFKNISVCLTLKYVHQLQNLYFYLTGEELNIEL